MGVFGRLASIRSGESPWRRERSRRIRTRRLGEAAIAAAVVVTFGWLIVTGAVTVVQALGASSSAADPSPSGPSGVALAGATGASGPSGGTPSGPSGEPAPALAGVLTEAPSYATPAGTYFSFAVVVHPIPTVSVSESGDLPDGVVFDPSSGTLSGTPASGTEGSYELTFTASDGVSPNAVVEFELVVGQPSAVVFPTIELPLTDIGETYAATLPTPTGTVGAVTYAIEWGDLPAGLSLDPDTGAITGVVPANDPGTAPWTTEVYAFEVTATDSQGNVASQYFYVIVFPRLSLPPADLPAVAPGDSYTSLAIAAVGGSGDNAPEPYACDPTALSCTSVGPGGANGAVVNSDYASSEYHYAVTEGALPPGISLDPSFGTLTGTVSAQAALGTDNFTITVTDTAGAIASQVYAIPVSSTAAIAPSPIVDGD